MQSVWATLSTGPSTLVTSRPPFCVHEDVNRATAGSNFSLTQLSERPNDSAGPSPHIADPNVFSNA